MFVIRCVAAHLAIPVGLDTSFGLLHQLQTGLQIPCIISLALNPHGLAAVAWAACKVAAISSNLGAVLDLMVGALAPSLHRELRE